MSSVNDLTRRNPKGLCESLISYENMRGKSEEVSPPKAKALVSKRKSRSNRKVLNAAAARLGQAYKETSDILQRDNLESTASVVNSVGGSNGDLPTELSISDLDDMTSILQNNDGEYITSMIGASDKIGTSPLGDAYAAMCTTRLIPVLNEITGFRRKFEYGTGAINTLASEWGGVNNTRFFVSSQGSVTKNGSILGNDVANVFITAQEGYKVVFQAGGRAKYLYTPPGGQTDPAHLRHMAACQFYQGRLELALNKSFLIDLDAYDYEEAEKVAA